MMTLRWSLGLPLHIAELGGRRDENSTGLSGRRLFVTGVHHRACWFKSEFALYYKHDTVCDCLSQLLMAWLDAE